MNTPAGTLAEGDYEFAERYAAERRDNFYRWGTRMLRGGGYNYSPCVKDKTGWQNYFMGLPYDYDIRNDPTFDLKRSTYYRLGDLGFPWPETETKETLRTGYHGPDKSSLTRPAFLRFKENDDRPEPAYRFHLTDRACLHLLRADPLEGVIPFGRQNDMHGVKSVSHRDFKWRQRCCAKPSTMPAYDEVVYRFAKTDRHVSNANVDQVITFDDDPVDDKPQQTGSTPLLKLKKAYNWPINPITDEPLGGRLLYYKKTSVDDPSCAELKNQIWPCGRDTDRTPIGDPKVIPDQRYQLLGRRPKNRTDRPRNAHNASILNMRFPTPNWECWEEVPDCCKKCLPSECCFNPVSTKGTPPGQSHVCPPKPPCPPMLY